MWGYRPRGGGGGGGGRVGTAPAHSLDRYPKPTGKGRTATHFTGNEGRARTQLRSMQNKAQWYGYEALLCRLGTALCPLCAQGTPQPRRGGPPTRGTVSPFTVDALGGAMVRTDRLNAPATDPYSHSYGGPRTGSVRPLLVGGGAPPSHVPPQVQGHGARRAATRRMLSAAQIPIGVSRPV